MQATTRGHLSKEGPTAMRDRQDNSTPRREAGFALILAILSLLLLTFLGLTMALSTSTELQIATNYRWSQQALYNAEAGLELAKDYLRDVEWRDIVPLPRGTSDIGTLPSWYLNRPGPYGEPSRNFEMSDCDTTAAQGYGIILEDPLAVTPYQNTSDAKGRTLNGTFTVWVRRPLDFDGAAGGFKDREEDDTLILTAEGTAPYVGAASLTSLGATNRAVRVIEETLSKIDPAVCENLNGQVGAGPFGSGFDQCGQLGFEGVPGAVGEDQSVR